MAESAYAKLRSQFAAEAEKDRALAHLVADRLTDELALRGINATVTYRAKDPDSSATKALLADMVEPLYDLRDRSGVRATVYYLEDIERVEQAARDLFEVVHVEDKLDTLSYDEIGYLGRHIDLRLRTEDEARDLVGRNAELQVRTAAQSAWAQISHEQLYKPASDVPVPLKRRIYRLVSLVELFDNEVAAFLREARTTPGYTEAQVISPLARVLLERFGDRRGSDRPLSLALAAALVPLYEMPATDIYDTALTSWIDDRQEKLSTVFHEMRSEGDHNPLIHQPEVFIILERLERDRLRLCERWPEASVPVGWLHDLAASWGERLTD